MRFDFRPLAGGAATVIAIMSATVLPAQAAVFYEDLPTNVDIVDHTMSRHGVGGPIIKNKLFYFGAIESQRSTIPRQTVFPQLASFVPTPETRAAFDYYKSLEKPFEQTNRASALTAKTDYQFASGDRLTLRYNRSGSTEENAVTTGAAVNPFGNAAVSNEGTEQDGIHNGNAQYTKLFSAATVNDLRFTGSAEVRPRLANSSLPLAP